MKRRRTAAVLVFAVLAGVALAAGPLGAHVRAAQLLVGFEDASADVEGVRVSELTLGGVPARSYSVDGGDPAILLVHGVHPGGIDEPRLQRFARLLCDAGFRVFTPRIASLAEFRFDPSSVVEIAAAADALAEREGVASVGVVGISFGGGLALRAAAEQTSAIHAVLAVGAHHDATRLVRWWTGEETRGPGGETPGIEPESYGAEVLAFAYAEDYFSDSPEAARRALGARLRSEAPAPRLERSLSPVPRAELRSLAHPGERLRHVGAAHAEELAAVSPAGCLGGVRARVHLLHGRDDPVVASTESLHIAAEVPPERLGGVVRTELLRHAEGNPFAGWRSQWEVVHLVADAIRDLEAPGL